MDEKTAADADGMWAISGQEGGYVTITHQRRDDNVYSWSYNSDDLTSLDGDDRGANIGLAPENPNSSGLDHVVVNARRHTSTSDVQDGGSGL